MPKGREEFFISLAGPLVNALIAAGADRVAVDRRAPSCPIQLLKEPTNENLAERIAAGNLLLFLFNLLPAYPMDGGRILRAALALRKPENEATRIAATAGRRLAVADHPGRPALRQFHAGLRRRVRLSRRMAGRDHRPRPLAHQRISGARGHDHGFPHAPARRHDPGRRPTCCWPPRSTIFPSSTATR